MNEPAPALIGLDWGTSSLRAYLISSHGSVVEQINTPRGIMQVPDRNFDRVLQNILKPWMTQYNVPMLASGMITSRNGWLETPYLPVPSGAEALANSLVPLQTASGARLHLVTGMMTEHASGPDVMRGEETQIVGAIAAGLKNSNFVMPGTHSKWVSVRDRRIEDFATYMSGEVFSALRDHTILGTLMSSDGPFSEEGFRRGVAAGVNAGKTLLNTVFHVRTLPLFEQLPDNQASDYLSGILIGAEIDGATCGQVTEDPVIIVGNDNLADRYTIAFDVVGQKSARAPENIVARGLFCIASSAGLLSS